VAALILESLIVRGIKYFLNVGTAGSLQYENVQPGDIVLCTKAVRNDGTSYHYLEPSKYSLPDKELTAQIEKVLKKQEISYKMGPTISIDAPYRWTLSKALQLRREGVLTSDMEASTVFAVSKFRKAKAAAIFAISDLATEDFKWEPKFHTDELKKGMEKLFKICVETFASVE